MKATLERLTEGVGRTGAALVRLRATGRTTGTWEGSQFKAEADRIAHAMLSEELRRIDDAIPILSEEDEQSLATFPDSYWLIDPIDGTASFAHGYAGYVCQAALLLDRQPSIAAVCAPEHQLMFAAEVGKGATRNGERITVADSQSAWTLIDNYPTPRGLAAEAFAALPCERYLESGSIGLKICRVAEGAADLFVKDVGVRDWDLAAPHLILTEAGGVMSDLMGEPIRYGIRERRHVGLIAAGGMASHARTVNWARSRVAAS